MNHTLATISALLIGAPALAQPSTTVISHGLTADFGSGNKSAWQRAMGRAIIDQSPGGQGAVLFYTPSDGAWNLHYGTVDPAEPIVLVFNWVFESDGQSLPGINTNYTEAAGEALYASLRDPQGAVTFDVLTDRNIHFIGHSRGTVVNSEAVRRLGRDAIPVDQLTALDPHPVNGFFEDGFAEDWDDPFPEVWENVTFADTYYRQDGAATFGANQDTDGYAIPGSYAVDLTPFLGDANPNDFDSVLFGCTLEHSLVHTWYHGTIDTTATSDGDCSINANWYAMAEPGCASAACSGYTHSALRAGTRPPGTSGLPIGDVPLLFNGDFQWSYAGWRYHGGAGSSNSQINSDATSTFVSLTTDTFIRHNRFFLPSTVTQVELEYRINIAGTDDALELLLTATDGTEYPATPVSASTTTPWSTTTLALPPSAPPDRTYTLTLRLIDTAAGTVNADVNVRRIDLRAPAPCPADLNNDGTVSAPDLASLLAGWGAPGPADLDNNNIVDSSDLAILIAAWGLCP